MSPRPPIPGRGRPAADAVTEIETVLRGCVTCVAALDEAYAHLARCAELALGVLPADSPAARMLTAGLHGANTQRDAATQTLRGRYS